MAAGLVAGHENEFGYFSLAELEHGLARRVSYTSAAIGEYERGITQLFVAYS
jgi:hypothetical protein